MMPLVLLVFLFLTLVVFFFRFCSYNVSYRPEGKTEKKKKPLSLQDSFQSPAHTVQAHVSLTISSCSNPNFACTYWIASIHPFFL